MADRPRYLKHGLREDLADGDLDAARVRGAVEYAVAAIEIVNSRIAAWGIRLTDTIADNGAVTLLGG